MFSQKLFLSKNSTSSVLGTPVMDTHLHHHLSKNIKTLSRSILDFNSLSPNLARQHLLEKWYSARFDFRTRIPSEHFGSITILSLQRKHCHMHTGWFSCWPYGSLIITFRPTPYASLFTHSFRHSLPLRAAHPLPLWSTHTREGTSRCLSFVLWRLHKLNYVAQLLSVS